MKWTNKHTLQIWGFEETKNGQQHGAPRIRVFQVLSLKRTHTWPCFQPPQSQTRSNWIRICSNCNPRAILNIAMEIHENPHVFYGKNNWTGPSFSQKKSTGLVQDVHARPSATSWRRGLGSSELPWNKTVHPKLQMSNSPTPSNAKSGISSLAKKNCWIGCIPSGSGKHS